MSPWQLQYGEAIARHSRWAARLFEQVYTYIYIISCANVPWSFPIFSHHTKVAWKISTCKKRFLHHNILWQFFSHGPWLTYQGSRPPSCTRRRQSRPLFWKCWLVLQQRCPLQQPSDHDASRRHPGEGYDTYNVLLKTSLCVCVFFCRGCGRHLSPAVKIKEWNGKI